MSELFDDLRELALSVQILLHASQLIPTGVLLCQMVQKLVNKYYKFAYLCQIFRRQSGGIVPEQYECDLAVLLRLFCLLAVRVCQWNCRLVLHSHLIQFKT